MRKTLVKNSSIAGGKREAFSPQSALIGQAVWAAKSSAETTAG